MTGEGREPADEVGTASGLRVPSPVGLVGLGVMGGSLARALAEAEVEATPEVLAWSREPADLEAAREAGVVSEILARPEAVAAEAELVVYAVPLTAAAPMLRAHRGLWRDEAVVTDVASLKAPLVKVARAEGFSDRYVGSHPMAGSESSGFGASRSDLFTGADVWVTTDTGGAPARQSVEALWRALEARPRRIEADAHDRRMVWVSHLPQLVATALAHVLEEGGVAPGDLGPGGRDMTRLAASSPELWAGLFDHAGRADARALDTLGGALHQLARDLREGRSDEISELMAETRRWRSEGTSSGRTAHDREDAP